MTKHFTKLVGWLQAQVQLQPKKRPASNTNETFSLVNKI